MAEPQPAAVSTATTGADRQPRQLNLIGRESAELIIGFSGAVGSGLDQVIDQTTELLRAANYKVEYIKLSHFIEKLGREMGEIGSSVVIAPHSSDRYETLQTAGNKLRQRFSNQVLAKLAVSKIAAHRTDQIPDGVDVEHHTPERVAFLIDQLKHPDEVELLRQVYGNLFYLVGVFASEEQRRRNLMGSMQARDAQRAMDRDRREEEDHGQHLDKALKLADLFVRNTDENRSSTGKQLHRLLSLVHGAVALTPTSEEYAMYAAYAAGLRSACMSRQVGAAITDTNGDLLTTGCNDVPKSKGGLYTAADADKDWRCFNWKGGECWNDYHKSRIQEEVAGVLQSKEVKEILANAGMQRDVSSSESAGIARLIAQTHASSTYWNSLVQFTLR
jgi:deoxycytidylate deaminase